LAPLAIAIAARSGCQGASILRSQILWLESPVLRGPSCDYSNALSTIEAICAYRE